MKALTAGRVKFLNVNFTDDTENRRDVSVRIGVRS